MWFNINMFNFVEKIISHILERRRLKLLMTLDKLRTTSYVSGSKKTHFDGNVTLTFSAEAQKTSEMIDEQVRTIVIPCLSQPEKLLEFVAEQGTKVYRFSFANKILNIFKEEDGFIAPFCGGKAFLLNFLVVLFMEKKLSFSFKTKPMFVLGNGDLNIYFLLHQFHKWYAYKSGLAGFDEKAQSLFKMNLSPANDEQMKNLSVENILALKEAIARDAAASDFVIKLSKEFEGAKNALNKIKNDGGAQV